MYFDYMKMWHISIRLAVWQRHKADILQLWPISVIYYSLTTPLHANSCLVLVVGQFQELRKEQPERFSAHFFLLYSAQVDMFEGFIL